MRKFIACALKKWLCFFRTSEILTHKFRTTDSEFLTFFNLRNSEEKQKTKTDEYSSYEWLFVTLCQV